MSKEKLEEIESILSSPGYVFFGHISDAGFVSQDVSDAEPYFKWLIEQAKRVPELESHLSKNGNKYRNQNKGLRKELKRMTRQKDKYQEKARLRQMRISSEDHKKEIRERTLEGYKNLKNKQHKRIKELEEQNKRYHEALKNVSQYINIHWDQGYRIMAELYIKGELEYEENDEEKET